MSFPRLIVEGDVTKNVITDIYLQYVNDTGIAKPERLTRAKYNIRRETRLGNISGGTSNRYPKLPYDEYRYVHTWTGYADVLTESVSITSFSDITTATTVALLKTAVLLENPSQGINHTIVLFDVSEEGPNKPSLGGQYIDAFDSPQTWVYSTDETLLSDEWVIRNIDITDKHNNTSRVTFTFEAVEPWQSLTQAVLDLD